MKKFIAYTLVFSLSVAFLGFLGCIWTFGSHYIQEPNLFILVVETVMMVLFAIYGLWNMVDILRRQQK